VARVGQDTFGSVALRLYQDEGVDAAWAGPSPDLATGVGSILVQPGSCENCIALDPGANGLLTAQAVAESEAALAAARVVLTQLETLVPALSVPVADTTCAGDAFNVGLAVALASGADLESAVRFAVVTGGLAVTKEGVIPSQPRREEALDALTRYASASR